MIYVMSDIHGCYAKYLEMLKKINFSEEDKMYILGDVVDRGENPVKVLLDMMERPNVIPLLGNHDYAFKKTVEAIPYHCHINDFMKELDEDELEMLAMWVMDGGRVTLEKYLALNTDEKHNILEYLYTFAKYKDITVNGKKYLLTHSGLDNFDKDKDMSEYTTTDFIYHRPKPDTTFYDDKMLIFGHTPTIMIGDKQPKIFKTPAYINIDCGCVYKGVLGCLELTTMTEYYV